MTTKEATCKERVREHLTGRVSDLRRMVKAERDGNEAGPEDCGPLNEYGLCFDYVEPETFTNQPEPFFRYQLSTGGPGDEFRFYLGAGAREPHRVEYWFLDWFDGAHVALTGTRKKLLLDIWNWLTCDGESVESLVHATKHSADCSCNVRR
jgi:hypothetical protein